MLCWKLHAALVLLETDSMVFKWVETGTVSTIFWCYLSYGQQQECSNLSEPGHMGDKQESEKALLGFAEVW